jgi:16S rRNA (cytosine967-C5)-methyltransferase
MSETAKIIKLLASFLQGESFSLLNLNPRITHYFNEIVRFWNKLNFILKKFNSDSNMVGINQIAKYHYTTYRILWEKASDKMVLKEVSDIELKFLKKIRTFSWTKALQNKDRIEKLSICEAVPSFMINHLLPVMNIEFLEENLKAMNSFAKGDKITARINKLLESDYENNLDEIIKSELKKLNISFTKDTHFENLIKIPQNMKSNVLTSSIYQKGCLIFQDMGSAAVVDVLSPQINEFICDMCAAPGIKTSNIAQKMSNQGKIIAGEFLNKRMRSMKQLLSHLRVKNTHFLNIDSIALPLRFQNLFDRILLDAPCTGSGTLLTNPELKWRQNQKFLHQNTILQKKLLQTSIRMLKPGGTLVYSTCSLYPEEGEHIIMEFFNQLTPQELPAWFSSSYLINGSKLAGSGRLFPSIHKTQGFFIAKFKKKER